MTPLDELRAKCERAGRYGLTNRETEDLARIVRAMLPVVEAACTAIEREQEYVDSARGQESLDAARASQAADNQLREAVAAFRAANREGETKAT